MDAFSAILIVMIQFFFGWCGEESERPAPPEPVEATAAR
jgi:hypothetical protein